MIPAMHQHICSLSCFATKLTILSCPIQLRIPFGPTVGLGKLSSFGNDFLTLFGLLATLFDCCLLDGEVKGSIFFRILKHDRVAFTVNICVYI